MSMARVICKSEKVTTSNTQNHHQKHQKFFQLYCLFLRFETIHGIKMILGDAQMKKKIKSIISL